MPSGDNGGAVAANHRPLLYPLPPVPEPLNGYPPGVCRRKGTIRESREFARMGFWNVSGRRVYARAGAMWNALWAVRPALSSPDGKAVYAKRKSASSSVARGTAGTSSEASATAVSGLITCPAAAPWSSARPHARHPGQSPDKPFASIRVIHGRSTLFLRQAPRELESHAEVQPGIAGTDQDKRHSVAPPLIGEHGMKAHTVTRQQHAPARIEPHIDAERNQHPALKPAV